MVEFNAGSQVKKTTLRQMVTLLVSVWIVVTLAGCGEKQVCHAELEWECNHAELHSFLLRQDLYQYEQARTYCEELTLHGKDDWRLPTDCELMAFASQSQGQIKANALHSRAATCWTSTPYHDSLLRYWAVSVFNKQAAPLSQDIYNAVICVRDK